MCVCLCVYVCPGYGYGLPPMGVCQSSGEGSQSASLVISWNSGLRGSGLARRGWLPCGESDGALVNGPLWLGKGGEGWGREWGWKMELPAWNEWMVEFLFCNQE